MIRYSGDTVIAYPGPRYGHTVFVTGLREAGWYWVGDDETRLGLPIAVSTRGIDSKKPGHLRFQGRVPEATESQRCLWKSPVAVVGMNG